MRTAPRYCLTQLSHFSTRPARHKAPSTGRALLHLDTAYSWESIRELDIEHLILCRDLDGFFDHVWNVHPSVGASPLHSPDSSVGSPTTMELSPRHTLIEGKVAQFKWLGRFPRLNFALAQAVLIAKLTRIVRRHGVDIIKAADPFYTGMLGLLLARLTGVPLTVCINANHDHMHEATGELIYPRLLPSHALEKRVARFVLERADLIAAGNEDNRQCALANGGRSERSTLFRCGTWVDPVHFQVEPADRPSVRSELGLGDRPFVIIVGRLVPVKHPDDVLAVLDICKTRLPDLGAVFVGDGSMRPELEISAAEKGLSNDVWFVGNRSQEWIANALSSATVVLSPLTGRALVEACLSGSPVVAYDVEWHSELVSNGETGILVPYRSIQDMADAVCGLVTDPSVAATLGKKGRSVTLQMMDPVRLKEHERSEYLKLLQNGKRRRPAPQPVNV